jgi:hypothetical protein
MATNKRIFYPAHSVAIKNNDGPLTWGTGHLARGVLSCGMTTNFNLTPLFQLGNIEIYENVEGLPDVEVTLQKVLDGHPLLYHLATVSGTDPTLVGRSNSRCNIALAVFPDTNNFASGTPLSVVACSGMYINSISYTFPQDGNATEDATFVGNDKVWTTANGTATGTPNYGETDMRTMPAITYNAHMKRTDAPRAAGGAAQSKHFNFDLPTGALTRDINGAVNHPDCTVLPTEIPGISLSGTNNKSDGENYDAHVSNISCSVSLNRETINELGRRGPYHRSVTFPVDVSCEISVTSADVGDGISVVENGIFGTGNDKCSSNSVNLRDRTIRLTNCEGIRVYLGVKNKLATVNYSGGDAGGGNVTTTYTYNTQNDFTIMHQHDPHASGATWWAQRNTNGFLTN